MIQNDVRQSHRSLIYEPQYRRVHDADLSEAILGDTIVASFDPTKKKGLGAFEHIGFSSFDQRTFQQTKKHLDQILAPLRVDA